MSAYSIGWIPTMSGNFCFDEPVIFPNNDRSPARINPKYRSDGFSFTCLRTLADIPFLSLFPPSKFESWYKDCNKIELHPFALLFGINTYRKDKANLNKDLLILGINPNEVIECIGKKGDSGEKASDCDYIKFKVALCNYHNPEAYRELERIIDLPEADSLDYTKPSLFYAEGLLFCNGLMFLKPANSAIMPSVKFELYSFTKDCWHSHKYHYQDADAVIAPHLCETINKEEVSKATQNTLNQINTVILRTQRTNLMPGQQTGVGVTRSYLLHNLLGLNLYSKSLMDCFGLKKQINTEHLGYEINQAHHNESVKSGIITAMLAIFLTIVVSFSAFWNDLYSSKNSCFYLTKIPQESLANNYTYFIAAFCLIALAYLSRYIIKTNPQDFLANYIKQVFSANLSKLKSKTQSVGCITKLFYHSYHFIQYVFVCLVVYPLMILGFLLNLVSFNLPGKIASWLGVSDIKPVYNALAESLLTLEYSAYKYTYLDEQKIDSKKCMCLWVTLFVQPVKFILLVFANTIAAMPKLVNRNLYFLISCALFLIWKNL